MVYQTDQMKLAVISEKHHGAINDVLVLQDLNSPLGTRYIALVLKDSECRKKALRILSGAGLGTGHRPFVKQFFHNEDMITLFPYREERRLFSFGPGQMDSIYSLEEVAHNLVVECMSSPIPYPFLYLVLQEKNVHITRDNSIYFVMGMDLTELDEKKSEAHCVNICAQLLLELLEKSGNTRTKSASYELIRKKLQRRAYSSFPELYYDIRLTASDKKKASLGQRLKRFWIKQRDRLFHILLAVCVIAVVIAAVMLVTQIFFGDVPLLRLFKTGFSLIGTEDLIRR